MKGKPDLFGEALADHYHGRPQGPFLVCDETGEYPIDLSFYLNEQPSALEAQAFAHVSGRILDVGCGAGRTLKYLQDQGFDAVGFDIDAIAVQLCKDRGVTGTVVGSFEILPQFSPVDALVWMTRTLCAAGDLSRISDLLEASYKICQSGGTLLFDSIEVRDDLSNRGDGVREDVLRFRYGDQEGLPFTRTYFASRIAERLVQGTMWTLEQILREEDAYLVVARKV